MIATQTICYAQAHLPSVVSFSTNVKRCAGYIYVCVDVIITTTQIYEENVGILFD